MSGCEWVSPCGKAHEEDSHEHYHIHKYKNILTNERQRERVGERDLVFHGSFELCGSHGNAEVLHREHTTAEAEPALT